MLDDLKKSALKYHRLPAPGKFGISATKPLIPNPFDPGLNVRIAPAVVDALGQR